MVIALVIVAGFVLGLAVGRWWALLAAVAAGLWITSATDVEVPDWFLGLAYATIAAAGISAGIMVRRSLRNSGRSR
jgi:hypothetical protein